MWMWRTDAGEVPSGVRHLEFSSGSERLLAITYAFYMYKYINSRLDVLSEKRKPAGNRPGGRRSLSRYARAVPCVRIYYTIILT